MSVWARTWCYQMEQHWSVSQLYLVLFHEAQKFVSGLHTVDLTLKKIFDSLSKN